MCNQICERIYDDDQHAALPDWMRNDGGVGEAGRWDELRELVQGKLSELEYGEDGYDFWDGVSDRLYKADHVGSTEEARTFMGGHYEELGLGCDYWEIKVDKPCERLIDCLYMINHAAKAIIARCSKR